MNKPFTVKDIQDIFYHRMFRTESLTRKQALLHALSDILAGFRDSADALDFAEIFTDREICCYTMQGYPISSKTIRDAVKLRKEQK